MVKKLVVSIICIFLINGAAFAAYKTDYFKMGKYQYKVSNYTGCIDSMKKALVSDPQNVVAHYYLGMAYTQMAQKSKASDEYIKVITLDPKDPIAVYAKKGLKNLTPSQNPHSSADLPFVDSSDTKISSKKEQIKNITPKSDTTDNNNSVYPAPPSMYTSGAYNNYSPYQPYQNQQYPTYNNYSPYQTQYPNQQYQNGTYNNYYPNGYQPQYTNPQDPNQQYVNPSTNSSNVPSTNLPIQNNQAIPTTNTIQAPTAIAQPTAK